MEIGNRNEQFDSNLLLNSPNALKNNVTIIKRIIIPKNLDKVGPNYRP